MTGRVVGYGVEVECDGELHTPHVPWYAGLATARTWAVIIVADLFRDAAEWDRAAARYCVDTLSDVAESDVPFTFADPALELTVRLYAVERVTR